VLEASGETQHFCDYVEAVGVEAISVNELRDGDVAFGAQRRKQIETLEDETDFVATEPGALGIAHGGEFVTVDQDGAFGGLRHAADYVEQRRFAAAGGSHNGYGLAGLHFEIDAAQSGDFHFARTIELPQILRFKYRFQ
jgi:hypothetical protein